MTIASSEVLVVADTSRFRQSARSGVTAAMAGQSVDVTVTPDTRGFRGAVNAALRGMRPVQIAMDARAQQLIRELRTTFAAMRPLQVPIVVKAGDVRNQLRQILRDLPPQNLRMEVNRRNLIRQIETILRGWRFEIRVRVLPDFERFDAAIRRHNPPEMDVRVRPRVDNANVTRSLSAVSRILAGIGATIGGVLAVGALGTALAGAASGAAAFVAALAPAAGIMAALPAAIATVRVAVGTLRLALMGVEDAFKAALTKDAAEFEKSLENLSPAARAAAREVRALKTPFEELRSAVQDSFFAQFEGEITRVASAVGGTLRTGLTAISTQWGIAARNLLQYVRSADALSRIQQVLGSSREAVRGLAAATVPVTRGFLDIAGSISQAFGVQAGNAIARAGQRLGDFLTEAALTGRAFAWVRDALTVFRQLGDVLGNLRTGFAGMFRAADNAGAGFLARLVEITNQFSRFTNSARGQDAFGSIFATVAEIGRNLGPILASLLTQVGSIAAALAPSIQILGPAVVQLLDSLGPALASLGPAFQTLSQAVADTVAALAQGGAFQAAADALGAVVSAVAPLLPLLGGVASVLVNTLAPALVNIASLFQPIIQAISANLLPLLPRLAAFLSEAVAAARPLAEAIGQSIAQTINRIADAFRMLGAQLGPVTPQLKAIARGLITVVAGALAFGALQAVIGVMGNLIILVVDAAAALINFGKSVKTAFDDASATASAKGEEVAGFFTDMWTKITEAFSSGTAAVTGFFTDLWASISETVTAGLDSTLGFFQALPDQIMASLEALPGQLKALFIDATAQIGIAVLTFIGSLIIAFQEFPARASAALESLGATLSAAFESAWTAVSEWLVGAFDATVVFFQELPTRISDGLSTLGEAIQAQFEAAWNATTAFLTSAWDATVEFFRALPGRISDALSSLGSQIQAQFSAAFAAADARIRSWTGSVVAWFQSIPGRLSAALNNLGSAISAKFEAARATVEGAVSGMISGIASRFSGLGAAIAAQIGDIGSQIVSKIKSGLPPAIRNALPFAHGGIVSSPTRALIGEAGREVVIPLTRPWRARELARQSGLLDLLNGGGTTRNTTVNAPMTISMSSGATDPRAVAERFADDVARRLGWQM